MLAVYTFVFSTVFRANWGNLEEAGPLGFAINLFAGLIVFNMFAECANRAPTLILENTNYVKRVIFPLEVLGAVTVGTALFHAFTSTLILFLFELIVLRHIPLATLWLPFVWLPLVLGLLGLTWLLSALGVFLRDLGQVMGVVVSMLTFMSAVFYPLSSLPKAWQPVLGLNPLALVIEQTRKVAVAGHAPGMAYLAVGTIVALGFCELSFRIFNHTRRGFADVL